MSLLGMIAGSEKKAGWAILMEVGKETDAEESEEMFLDKWLEKINERKGQSEKI